MAGIIAQCEVEVDRFEGSMVLEGADLPDTRLAEIEQEAQEEAAAAVSAYRPCAGS